MRPDLRDEISSWADGELSSKIERAGVMCQPRRSAEQWIAGLKPQIAMGLHLLLQANALAADSDSSGRDFGVEIHVLRQVGLSECHLRWLIRKGYVEHLLDTTLPGEIERAIRPVRTERFLNASCFALTQAGVVFAEQLPEFVQRIPVEVTAPPPPVGQPFLRPIWDSKLRQLLFQETIIKRCRVPSPNQELILCAFEEEGWPSRIDDPLPPKSGVAPIKRLTKSIYRLNQSLDLPLVRFSCDTASVVSWEVMACKKKRATKGRRITDTPRVSATNQSIL